jgi:hypothetical protein
VFGVVPLQELLEKYNLLEFAALINHYKKGDLKGYNIELFKNGRFFRKYGVFTILQHWTKIVLYRNLFSRMYIKLISYRILGTNIISLQEFGGIIRNYEDLSNADVESLFVSLLDKGYIKGYISPDKKIVVLKKLNPFPLPNSVRYEAFPTTKK